jgi:tricorn protease
MTIRLGRAPRTRARVLLSFTMAFATVGACRASPVLMRFPTTSATEVAFVARGGLWAAPLAGGRAKRISDAPGDVLAPRFSPDGRWIAFTRSLGGDLDLYVAPSAGGDAKRLTFDGAGGDDDNLDLGWTPDGKRIVFLSSHGASNSHEYRAFSVPLNGGQPEPLPLDRAGLMSFSPDGREIVYNRVFRNFELRKRYLGGQHQNLYRYDFASKTLTRLTDWKGTDTSPMWSGRKVFFLSDRGSDFRKSIWVLDLDTRAVRQITRFADYDVDWPSLGAGGIAFQQGGKLYRLDPSSEQVSEVKVEVPDDGAETAPREADASGFVRVKDALGGVDYSLSPHGAALLISAHGDLVQVTIHDAPVDLTHTPGVDEDHPSWSLDGRWIAYTTDVDGEQQVAVRPAAGGPERRLTHSRAGYFYSAAWSPEGDTLAVADANHALWLIPLDGSGPKLVARDPYAEIRDAAFSPDGRWLAYSTQRATRLRAIHLREIESGRDVVVSSPMESDRLPVFTADGRYLAFVSQRHEQPFVSDRDDESLITTINSDGVYIAPLSRFDGAPGGNVARPALAGPMRIDLDGLMARATALPITPAVIKSLEARGDELFYETQPPQLIGGDLAGQTSALRAFDLATLKDREAVKGLSTHALSADGSAVAFRRDGVWRLASTRPETKAGAGTDTALDLSAIRVPVDPRRDWTDMLKDAWRLDRDVFFSPAMNGTDWRAVHDAYARLWPLIGSEQDFLYLLGEMQGEIASSHIFVDASPAVGPKAPATTPLLGADYTLDAASGRYRIARIYPGDQSRDPLRGPLGAPGLNVAEGDYLLAVDGHELRAPAAPLSVFAARSSSIPSGPSFRSAAWPGKRPIGGKPIVCRAAV